MAIVIVPVGQIQQNNYFNHCKYVEKNFNSTTATVSQKKEYSECISMLYPTTTEISPESQKILEYGLIISFIIFFIMFIYIGIKQESFGVSFIINLMCYIVFYLPIGILFMIIVDIIMDIF